MADPRSFDPYQHVFGSDMRDFNLLKLYWLTWLE